MTKKGLRIQFCPYCGRPAVMRYLFEQERPTCPACDWIYFEDPKVAAAALVEKEGQVLLARRVNEPFQGLWSLPAGFVNAHENPARAAERECQEETGLQVRVTGLADVISGREHRRGADIILIYHAEITGGILSAGDDADQAEFFGRNALPPLAFRATRIVLGLEEKTYMD